MKKGENKGFYLTGVIMSGKGKAYHPVRLSFSLKYNTKFD
jgi:hypothetical protein